MEQLIDYYKEFDLNRKSNLEDIIKQLIKQERIWNSRQHVRPEEARKKLVLIDEAKVVFATESSRRKYHEALDLSQQDPLETDSDKDDYYNFDRWLRAAHEHFSNKDYDLAEAAIEKVLYYRPKECDEIESLGLAAVIYNNIGKYDLGMKYANEAILIDPNYGWNYRYKYYLVKSMKGYVEEAKKLLYRYVSKEEANKDRELTMEAYDFSSKEIYFGFGDKTRGEELARSAIKIGGNCPNAKRIIDEISKKHKKIEDWQTGEGERIKNQNKRNLQMEIEKIKLPKEPKQVELYQLTGKWYVLCGVFLLLWLYLYSNFEQLLGVSIVSSLIIGIILFCRFVFKITRIAEIDEAKKNIESIQKQME